MLEDDFLHKTLPSTRYTPYSLAKKLGATALLESATGGKTSGRYSIIMCDKAFDIIEDDNGIYFLTDGVRTPFDPSGKKDFLDALMAVACENKIDTDEIPLPLSGIGYLGYEYCAHCDTIKLSDQKDELGIAQSHFLVGHTYAVVDHYTELLHIFALNYKEHSIDLKAAVENLQKTLNNLDFSYLSNEEAQYPATIVTNLSESKREFCDSVVIIKNDIIDGRLMQAVPSRRLQIKSDLPALTAYQKLRALNPSPYMIYLDFGDNQIVGASPESLVTVTNGEAFIHPIAGTRARGKDHKEDKALQKELLSDKKECAEHLMLVDLARNDLGRVSSTGAVTVERFMDVEYFSHVMHITSLVKGVLKEGLSPAQALRAAFPAGTVSGAPKIAAIERLSKLESTARRFYAGAVGYIGSGDNLDFCIAIRCALRQSGGLWTLQAGAGIVLDSIPSREWEETGEKLGALTAIFGIDKKSYIG